MTVHGTPCHSSIVAATGLRYLLILTGIKKEIKTMHTIVDIRFVYCLVLFPVCSIFLCIKEEAEALFLPGQLFVDGV